MHRLRSKAVQAAAAAAILVSSAHAIAAPQRLDCKLTSLETQGGPKSSQEVENRPIVVVFDEQSPTLAVHQDGKTVTLGHVTITPNALTGFVDDFSLGIERGSWNIVVQTYGAGSMSAEFGACSPSAEPPPADGSR